jgi:hypothetical protein
VGSSLPVQRGKGFKGASVAVRKERVCVRGEHQKNRGVSRSCQGGSPARSSEDRNRILDEGVPLTDDHLVFRAN